MDGPWDAHKLLGHQLGCVGVHCMPPNAFWMGYNSHYSPTHCFGPRNSKRARIELKIVSLDQKFDSAFLKAKPLTV
jgi:hypothetical protein